MTYRKKLIEVALPLEEINTASVREMLNPYGPPGCLQPSGESVKHRAPSVREGGWGA